VHFKKRRTLSLLPQSHVVAGIAYGKPCRDAHDILGTYQIIADDAEMVRIPASFADLERLLKRRATT